MAQISVSSLIRLITGIFKILIKKVKCFYSDKTLGKPDQIDLITEYSEDAYLHLKANLTISGSFMNHIIDSFSEFFDGFFYFL
jgi:hypothetical protein